MSNKVLTATFDELEQDANHWRNKVVHLLPPLAFTTGRVVVTGQGRSKEGRIRTTSTRVTRDLTIGSTIKGVVATLRNKSVSNPIVCVDFISDHWNPEYRDYYRVRIEIELT